MLTVDFHVDKSLKYYEVMVIGIPTLKPDKMPELNEDGSVKVTFSRKTNPPDRLQENSNLRPNPWFQCQLLEANLGEDKKTSASGKQFRIGTLTRKAYPQNIFYNTHNQVYMEILGAIQRGEFRWMVKADPTVVGGGNPVIMITGPGGEKSQESYVVPGHAYEFPTGFPYKVYTRDRETKEMKELLATTYDDKGRVKKINVTKTTGNIFLFASEIENAEAHIQNMINICARTKITAPTDTERHEEALTASEIGEGLTEKGSVDEPPTV